jgi:hypothetical protein
MTWRLAKSLETLRKQIDTAAPGRSKASDGTIGDAAHASRSSDHNPWVMDGKTGVVTAIDITHDPRNGVDCDSIAAALKGSLDTRIKYIIWKRRIWTPAKGANWRPYTGTNPHDKHVHISVMPEKAHYDRVAPWQWGGTMAKPDSPAVNEWPLLFQGVTGQDAHIAAAKAALMEELASEKGFGPLLDGLTRGFQKREGLTADGKIGAYSWAKITSA